MRTKRKQYDYHSSDYGNEDYGQEDFEGEEDDFDEDDQAEESEVDSDYGDSADEKGKNHQGGKSRASKKKDTDNQYEERDDTYEDEDPFSPEIDLILADKVTEGSQTMISSQCNLTTQFIHQLIEIQISGRANRQTAQAPTVKPQNKFLIKFVDQSYLHIKWMTEQELEEYSYRAKQKIRRYWNQKEKKRLIQEQISKQAINFKQTKNHHFSEDEEEEEDEEEAAIKGIALPDLPLAIEDVNDVEIIKPRHIKVESQDGEDLTQYFDKNYTIVERVLSTTQIFPIIHPRQAKQIRGKWQEDCLKVMNVLINFRKNNVCLGLAFAEQLEPEKLYQQPQDFWNDLGLVFKNCRLYYKSSKTGLRKQCDALRCLAYNLYDDWHKEQKQRFTTGIAIIPPQPQAFNTSSDKSQQPPERDTTIVNLSSLLKNKQNNQQQEMQQQQQQQQVQQPPQPQQPIPQMQAPLTPNIQPQQQQLVAQQSNQQQLNMMRQSPFPQQQDLSGQQSINDIWNQQRVQQQVQQQQQQPQQMMNNQLIQQQLQQQQQQQQQPPPNLPKFNSIVNPINPPNAQGFPDPNSMMGQQQQQQNQIPQFMNQPQNPQMNPNFMNQDQFRQLNQQQNMMYNQQQPQNQYLNPNQQQFDIQQNILQGPQGNLFQLGGQNNMGQGVHLPSIGSIQPGLLQGNLMGQANQMGLGQQMFGGQQNQMMDINQMQALQQDPNKNMNFINQMMGLQGQNPALQQLDPMNQMAMMQTGQDFSQYGMRQQQQPQLPSINQFPGFNQQPIGGYQLPSIAQMSMGSNMSTFDPYNQSMMQQNFMNQMQPQQQMFNRMNMQNPSTGFNTVNAYDEMSMMLGGAQNTINPLPGGFNPFGQMDMTPQQQQMMAFGGGQMNPFVQNQFSMPVTQQKQVQKTTIIDPNLIQPDNVDLINEKQDPPVPPCIIDPGAYDLTWLLDNGDSIEELKRCPYLTQEEIENAVNSKHYVDTLYLIKWKGLSYTQSTWEPESKIREFEDKLNDYQKFNRSLDQFQRDRLDQLIKNHKKMFRYTEKKYQQGKRIDPQQENLMSLHESKINRTLLNQKIQEIMGDAFYKVVQYSEQQGIVPQFKKPNQRLKDYQVTGLNWLIRAWHEHRNVVLADEMGLGKTIMTLSLFDHLNKVYKLRGPYLILAPLTTLEHWKRIADEWTNLNSVLYYDPNSSEGRNEIRQWEWFYTDVTYKGTITQKSELYKFNILITSFEVFMQDLNPILQEIPFIYIVVDEAHRLKNKQAKTLKLLKDHPCKRILLLTGTPVQNNTKELWTLLNYIEPEKFDSVDRFLEQYGNLETYEQIQNLHKILKPHFLRRLKEEVDNSIPPLNETVIEVGLTTLQNTYYKGIYGENRMMLAKFGTNSIKTSQLNNIDVQLRKCCNHLFLLKGVEEELTRDCKNEQDLYKKLLDSSGKLMLLDKFIEKFKQENHKMLIFSQFKRMLDVIELYLKMKAVPYEKLTGSVKTQDRISAIQRFNDDKTFGVFLLTTRAGGLGINLTSARVVIIFDSDWNPQNDLQAIARAHRIGQKFEVQVYRLITSKTYEEQMFERASKKLGMEQALFSKGAFNQTDEDFGAFNLRGLTELKQDSKEIENLLKYGAYAFIDDENDEQVNNKDIDEILATGKKKEFTYSKGLYTLQKSTFNASKYEKLPNVDDPEFWNKVMPYDTIISINVLERKFKKEKKDISKSEKLQKEFIKDLEIVFNDFMDAKFDVRTNPASRKQLESDEEKLRELLRKMSKLNGLKLQYVERCKDWLRGMLKTNKRKKQPTLKNQASGVAGEEYDDNNYGIEDPEENEDDIIMYDSEEGGNNPRSLRKRNLAAGGGAAPQKEGAPKPGGAKRGRKKKVVPGQANGVPGKASVDESENAYEEEGDIYGEEEDKEYVQKQKGNNNFSSEMNNDDDFDKRGYGESSDDEQEIRYGLRGRRKRQKTGREEMLLQQQQRSGQSLPKMNDQFAKRNEKNGIVCAYCLHPETPNNLCAWFCSSYCQRFFHEDCKDNLFATEGKRLPNSALNKGHWQCDDCLDNKALCFCCKTKGQILLFPKKGKPKAAGQESDANLNLGISLNPDQDEDEMLMDEIDDDDDMMDNEVEPDLLDEDGLINDPEPVEPVKAQEPKEQQENGHQEAPEDKEETAENKEKVKENEIGENKVEVIKDEVQQENVATEEKPKEENSEQSMDVQNAEKPENEEIKGENDQFPETELVVKQQVSTKIVINTTKQQQDSSENKQLSPVNEEGKNSSKYVVRCTLGGCFKYYHVKCVYMNKNVSCINSMKVQRFRCPLHYCEICQASGDSVLIVQCVTCPTAYHLKCLPKDQEAIRLTKKYIVCGKHKLNPDDFPKYEEKANANLYTQRTVSQTAAAVPAQPVKVEKRGKKKVGKKRGRKPRIPVNEEYDDEYSAEGGAFGNQGSANHQSNQISQVKTQKQPQQLSSAVGAPSGGAVPQTKLETRSIKAGQSSGVGGGDQSLASQSSNTFNAVREMPKPLFTVEKYTRNKQ